MSGPISAWRSSYLSSSMTFAVPETVVAASVGAEPVASGDAVLGSVPLTVDDAFHIGSMTKLFTAALIMQLDQERILSLDDTLDRWSAEAPNASAITVRMLLQHESGLAELDFDLVGTATTQQVVDNVFAQPAVTPPGTAYAYLNAGYLILGASPRRRQISRTTSRCRPVSSTGSSLQGLTLMEPAQALGLSAGSILDVRPARAVIASANLPPPAR